MAKSFMVLLPEYSCETREQLDALEHPQPHVPSAYILRPHGHGARIRVIHAL